MHRPADRLDAARAFDDRRRRRGAAALARYSARLDGRRRGGAGDNKRFTGVMCESFHDVWMELHEDLIVMQRIDRVAEGSF